MRATIPTPRAALLDMLTYCRPANSNTEAEFITKFIMPLGAMPDGYGNLHLTIGHDPTILWSSHTDTVHAYPGRQSVKVIDDIAMLSNPGRKSKRFGVTGDRNCLGADCTTGVWLMCEMAMAGVPGLYIWHREEESGGRGSGWIADNAPQLLTGIRHAIAFDRKGIDSVITHQFTGRCCSGKFALELGQLLGGAYAGDDGGSFTDTASYTALVAECTNLSIGYEHCHSPSETQDLLFAMALRDRMVSADFTTLGVYRDPDADTDGGWWRNYTDDVSPMGTLSRLPRPTATVRRSSDLGALVFDHPQLVADFLQSHGFTAFDVEDYGETSGALVVNDGDVWSDDEDVADCADGNRCELPTSRGSLIC